MLFIFLNSCTQFLRVLAVKTYAQLHNDFTRFDQCARGNQGIATLLELDAAVRTENAMATGQVQGGRRVGPHRRPSWLASAVAARTPHFAPVQDRPPYALMRTRITGHPA